MTEQECLERMVPPGRARASKPTLGVIQIHITRACDLSCYNCTQMSNLGGRTSFMTPEQFEIAVKSLTGYPYTVGVFGGNPCLSPHFGEYCEILQAHVPQARCGLWSNNINGWGEACRRTFNGAVSNINVHLSQTAYDEIKATWPEARPFGLHEDSRHSPCYVAMKDVLLKKCPTCEGYYYDRDCQRCNGTGKVYDIDKAHELISACDINQRWSALLGVFRGEVKAWFCEIAGAMSMIHQWDENWQQWDTGLRVDRMYDDGEKRWWQLPMHSFTNQVRQHCHNCSVPLRGHGELAQSSSPESREQVSVTHQVVYKPKRKDRRVELVTVPEQLGKPLESVVRYLQNSHL